MIVDGTTTALVTGASSGIGRALAHALLQRGATVILAGRDRAALEDAAAGHSRADIAVFDMTDAAAIEAGVAAILVRHPRLDLVIANAGVQMLQDFAEGPSPEAAAVAREVATNLTGPIQLAAAVMPHLRRRERAAFVAVGSGLGYVPLAAAPVYSATKAGLHAFVTALRWQMRGTAVRVVALVPPVVETNLHRDQGSRPPGAMTLDAFTQAAMAGLLSGRNEVAVGGARVLRLAARIAPRLFLKMINTRPRGARSGAV